MPADPIPSVTAALIEAQGRELYGFTIPDGRAAELAGELDRIQRRMATAVPAFWFFDEPIQFLAELEASARPEDGR